MINFRKAAQKAVTLSELMADREKMTTEELIDEGGEVRIVDFEPVTLTKPNGTADDTWVYITQEHPQHFLFAGFVLKKIFDGYLKEYDGDLGQLRADFKTANGIKVRLEQGETKGSKNDITLVTVL